MTLKSLQQKLLLIFYFTISANILVAQKYSQKEGLDVAKAFFKDQKKDLQLSDKEIDFVVTRDYVDESIGIRHIYLQQQLNGLDVVNGNASVHLQRDGSVAHYVSQLQKVNVIPSTSGSINSQVGLRQAMMSIGMPLLADVPVKAAATGVAEKTIFKAAGTTTDIPVRKVYITNRSNQVRLAWEVQLFRRDLDNYWIIYIDANTGNLIAKQDMVVKCNFGPGLVTDEPGEVIDHSGHHHYFVSGTSPKTNFNVGVPENTRIDFLTSADKREGDKTEAATSATAGAANSYRVYDSAFESPSSSGAVHALKTTSGDTLASPDGWHKIYAGAVPTTHPYTRGNNVWAFHDPAPVPLGGVVTVDPANSAYNNSGPGGTPKPDEPFGFDYPVNLTQQPETYRLAAIVNLFYWNNLMHDVFYRFGFTEASGNFQKSHDFSTGVNRGNKPSGQNDEVLAQAQDGGGTNNANFLTLADGTNGQMQMYLWTGSLPDSLVGITFSENGIPPVGKRYFAIQGSFGAAAGNSTDLHANPVLDKPFVIVKKNPLGVGTETQGCGTGQQSVALPPSNDVSGKIVLIDRGNCSFVEKVLGAQQGGAAGVIIINNVEGPPIAMGGTDAPNQGIMIPAVMISLEDGKFLKTRIIGGDSLKGNLKKNFPTPKRDGDFDNGVIAHEYGHGISTRLTAGGPNPTSRLGGEEQGGEGWSDYFGLYMTTRKKDLLPATAAHPNGVLPNRGIGNYVTYQPENGRGIRPTPYSIDMSVNPSTYKTVGKGAEITIPHGVGYVWCTMLYEMQQALIDQYGFNDSVNNANPIVGATNPTPASAGGNNIALRLIMEGLKLQPASPTFVQQRNAILKADTILYGAKNACTIWRAFAKRGLGFSAVSNTNAVGDEVEQFNSAPACDSQTVLKIAQTGPGVVLNGFNATYVLKISNITPAPITATNLIVRDTLPAHTTYISSDGGTLSGNVVTWPVTNLAKGDTITHTVQVLVNHPSPATLQLSEDNEGTPANNKFQDAPEGPGNWNLISTGASSGTKTWFVENYDIGGSNATLRMKSPITVPANAFLIFNHKFATEAKYDGGVVEYSSNGTNWTHLNTFTKNGYNGTITTVNNQFIGPANLPAFTGASPGYIQSIASLNALAGQSLFFRFRFTSDPGGGSVDGGGWWVDDISIASPASFISSKAVAVAPNSASTVIAETGTLVIVPAGPLPVTGVDLTANVRNRQIVLNWKTTSEIDNRGFEITRRAANETDFTSLGFVNGAGNSNSERTYTFVDQSAAKGIRYEYRLRMVATDNTAKLSNIATAMIIDKLFAFTLAPNPATDHVILIVNNDSRNAAEVMITDIAGKVVRREMLGNASYLTRRINLTGLSKGMYMIEVTNGTERQTEKLIVE
jgi:extracellular elastinolytic metalloproteinase